VTDNKSLIFHIVTAYSTKYSHISVMLHPYKKHRGDDEMSVVTLLLSYGGTGFLSFCGTKTALFRSLPLPIAILRGLLAAFGGGLCRDIFILGTMPSAFSDPVSILLALAVAFATARLMKMPRFRAFLSKKPVTAVLCIIDALYLAEFIAMGTSRAKLFEVTGLAGFICGPVTGTFGGLLSKLLDREHKHTIKGHLRYMIIAASCAAISCFLFSSGEMESVERMALSVSALVGCILLDQDTKAYIWRRVLSGERLGGSLGAIPQLRVFRLVKPSYSYAKRQMKKALLIVTWSKRIRTSGTKSYMHTIVLLIDA
jgi:uncharacterized membrane protein YeiH